MASSSYLRNFRYLSGDEQYRTYDIQPIMQALQLILSAHPNRPAGDGVMLGKNEKRFFQRSTTDQPFSLGAGLQAWRGFSSSVRPAHKSLMVNVNICTTAFYTPGNLAEQMVAFMAASFSARPDT